jgi:high affinity Mn2+ porin
VKYLVCYIFVIVGLAGSVAHAGDTSIAAFAAIPVIAHYDWSGLYVGGHVGYARGRANPALQNPDVTGSGASFGSLYGGVQLGYNYFLSSRFLLGVEADISFPNYLGANDVAWSGTTARDDVTEKIDYVGTLRGRFGYAFDNWLLYGTGGLAWSQGRFLQEPPGATDPNEANKVLSFRTGWTAGAGVEVAIEHNWTARLEYLYSQFASANVVFPSGTRYASTLDTHTLQLGLNYKFGWPGTDAETAKIDASPSPTQFKDWEIHGQTTYIQQGYPGFRSPYYGANSLTPWPQTRETWSTSAFVGRRLWEGGELYYNPELIQGFGLNATYGVAGFPNGEAQKSNFAYPHYITSRLFLRQTFGLGGEQETIESDYGQMAGKPDISRLTFQVGKFAVHDMFDNNTYAADPRTQFQNWSIWAAGAFDYPGDMVGLTYGAVAELKPKAVGLARRLFSGRQRAEHEQL